jgi:glycosyltransferase involved in cell wall biosynthesis
MKIKKKPFFTVVIPLFNKEMHIKRTIESVLSQSFQDFEIVVVNDGSKDNSVDIIEILNDDRIKVFNQSNAGVSAARNRGVKEAKAEYIALLDADDLWLPDHLENLSKLIFNFPQAGIYATAYNVRSIKGVDENIYMHGLPSGMVSGLIPNYFNSVAHGDNLVCSSAVCIPKKVFEGSKAWFPVGEKYGEDQYVWARIAVQYVIAYCTKPSAIYDHGVENNTIDAVQEEKDPHKSFYMIKDLRPMIIDKEKLNGFDEYVSKIFYGFPYRNMIYRSKLFGLKQMLTLPLTLKDRLKLILFFIIPRNAVLKLKYFKSRYI